MLVLAAMAAARPKPEVPLLLWNGSSSVPPGLYWVRARSPPPGSLAVIRLPPPLRQLADVRGYLPGGALLIKPVAAGEGDVVCRIGASVDINGRPVAIAKSHDTADRPMPRWSGCIRLESHHSFVLSAQAQSFDSRYFGPIDGASVLGTAYPILIATH
jgi:conjugative transfer signal peptidase TraF